MKHILIFIGVMLTATASAQTFVSGGIFSNTTWTLANAPYIVTGDIAVFPTVTLTIEPGVEVKFDGYFSLEVRGELLAIGTPADSITFTSNMNTPAMNDWYDIDFTLGAADGYFEYCNIEYSQSGINGACSGPSYISNSTFAYNSFAHRGCVKNIDDCKFIYNTYGINADTDIRNSVFQNNDVGIIYASFYVSNSLFEFTNEAIAETLQTSGTIDSCTIINNIVGIGNSKDIITNSIISNNTIGIKSMHQSYANAATDYYVPIKYNRICNNTQYNVENGNSYNKDITENCFCTTDSIVTEDKLKDGYDNIALGLFNYYIYDLNCQTVLQTVFKIGPPTSISELNNKPYVSVYPNPTTGQFTVANATGEIQVYDLLGNLVLHTNKRQVDMGDKPKGIYMVRVGEAVRKVVLH